VVEKILGPKMEEVTGNWSNLHNEELHDLYFSPNIIEVITIKEDKMGGTCPVYGGSEDMHTEFGGKTGRKGTNWKT